MLIYPSFMNFSAQADFGDVVDRNLTIKIGQIIKANFPKQEEGTNPAFITYDVMVNDKMSGGHGNSIFYDCLPSQMFGSAADYLEYSLRSNVKPGTSDDEMAQEDILTSGKTIGQDEVKKLMGATVLVVCPSGSSSNAIIIGFLPSGRLDQNEKYKPQKEEDGKFLKFNFNGISVDINNDGELFLQRKGPTDSAGALTGADDSEKSENEKAANSFVKINKAGEILISTTAKEDAQEASSDDIDNLILIDKKGNITIKIDGGEGLTLKDKDGDTTFKLGDGAKTVAIAEELKNMYDELKSKLDAFDKHIHPSGMGPTGTPNPTVGAPSWNDAINSKRMTLPK